jgi:hypothetical protein
MKNLLLAVLPALLLSSAVGLPAAKAQDAMPSAEVSMRLTLTPFNLAYLAYQGYFLDQGIPEAGNLMDSFRSGQITGIQVVTAAVNAKKLPASFLKNTAYINAVSAQLYSLTLSN